MRATFVLCLALLLAGCTANRPSPTTETTGPEPSFTLPASSITLCDQPASGTAHATPGTTVETGAAGSQRMTVLVAHRDGIARYDTDGSEEIPMPTHQLPLGFSDGLGYRFNEDGSAVFDEDGVHRFDANLRRTASWNATRVGGALHHGGVFYSTANGKLVVLSDQLVARHTQDIPGWSTPIEPRYDALHVVGNHLIVGSAGRWTHLLVYELADPESPSLTKEILAQRTEVPIVTTGAGPGGSAPRSAPWIDSYFSDMWSDATRLFVWRDGAYQGHESQTVSRFQEVISVARSNWSIERIEQQYLEDNHGNQVHGARVGPIDPVAQWALLHVRGTFSLAHLVDTGTRVVPACHVDIQMSSFAPEDAFFQRTGNRILFGTQTRVDAWDVNEKPTRMTEARLTKSVIDARWT